MKDILQALLEILLVAAIVFAIGFVIINIIDTHDKVDIIYKKLLLERLI